MTLQISMLEETVQRLHIRLQRTIRSLYVLHGNGNDEAALVALSRIEQINTRIAELNALLDGFDAEDAAGPIEQDRDLTTVLPILEEPVTAQEVILDDPDQDDVEMEYRGTLLVAVLVIIVVALGMLFGSKILNLGSDIADKAAPAAVERALEETALPIPEPPVVVEEADIDTVTYVVQKGDTLWSIATTQLGDPQQWATIYGQNASVIGDDPNLIFPGQVLTITKVSVGSTTIG